MFSDSTNKATASQRSIGPHLNYYGGRVLTKPTVFGLYLGDFWNTQSGKRAATKLDAMGNAVLSSNHFDVLKEYGVKKATYGGSSVVSTPIGRNVTEEQIQQTVWDAVKQQKFGTKLPAESIITVYLPRGATLFSSDGVSSREGMGGYHGSFDAPTGQRIYYAAIAYADRGNGVGFTRSPTDNMSIAATHEWAEAATDPDVNNGTPGWYDEQYGEVGDIPIVLGESLKDDFGRIGGFAVQKEWSNRDGVAELEPERELGSDANR